MWGYYLRGGGGGYGALDFHAFRCDLLECDSSERRDEVHRRSVPVLHRPPCFSGEGGVSAHKYLNILSHCLFPLYPVLIQRLPNILSQPSDSPLIPPGLPPRGDSLVNESPRLCQYPRVVVRCLFVRLWNGAPQLEEDLVCPRPCLMSGQS